jgi:hypothetical protein
VSAPCAQFVRRLREDARVRLERCVDLARTIQEDT